MKKQVIVLLALLSTSSLFSIPKNQMNQTIISVHTRVFGKDDLFKARPDAGDSKAWNDMIQEVKKYVTQNAAKDKTLINNLNQAENLANDLLNLNKIIYSSVFYSKTPSRNTVLTAGQQLNDLQKKKAALVKLSDALKKQKFSGSKKDAAEILNNYILVLELTANKLIKDFNKALARVTVK